MSKIPEGLIYTRSHEYIESSGSSRKTGITDYAQGNLGDVVFVELPAPDTEVKAGQVICSIESVKAVAEVYSPVNGRIDSVNESLKKDPAAINRDPYGEGFLVTIVPSDDPSGMDADGYAGYLSTL